LPIVELRPNRIASGLSVNLLEFEGDLRALILFALALLPFALAFRKDYLSRGWMLALVGNLILILSLMLPSNFGQDLLDNVETYFPSEPVLLEPVLLEPGENAILVEQETAELRFLVYNQTYPANILTTVLQPPRTNPNTGELRDPEALEENEAAFDRASEGNLLYRINDPQPGRWIFEISPENEEVEIYVQSVDAGVLARAPRLLPSAAIALGLLAGYIILFAALSDLRKAEVDGISLNLVAWTGVAIIAVMFFTGTFDNYSIMIELENNGSQLGNRFIEHITFVSISIIVGCIVGISLGLWASRDERVAPVILYAVGIIQTIPSLALFGLLLEPLAIFGDQLFIGAEFFGVEMVSAEEAAASELSTGLGILEIFFILLAIAVVFLLIFGGIQRWFRSMSARNEAAVSARDALQNTLLIIAAIALSLPLALFTVSFVSFLFRIVFLALTEPELAYARILFLPAVVIPAVLWLAQSRIKIFKEERFRIDVGNTRLNLPRFLMQLGAVLAFAIILVYILVEASIFYLDGVDNVAVTTMRDLGVSGIGVAPALIALTLYSLLPLVRNTYAGLNNVDPAIIDSGRGMGMAPTQIFFRIELPLAFPVIMAGIRNAAVALVGIGTIATVIGAGGLGDLVLQGITNTSIDLILLGAIPAIFLAALLDILLRLIENTLTSPGIKYVRDV
jgi:ABC-type proline/glycine betaine transport system permease subunit